MTGCADQAGSPPPTPVAPGETSWEQQIAAVRALESSGIRVSHKPVTADQWTMLAEGCAALEVLETDATALTADDFALLAELPKLRQLVLHGPVTDDDLQRLTSISLETLNLPSAQITNAGLSMLAALPQLELLRFSSPHVTDEGMAAIARLPALRFLHLIDVPITDAGLTHLHAMKQLESLYLDGGNCTDAGLRMLLKALPELHFHRDQLHLPDDPHAHPHE